MDKIPQEDNVGKNGEGLEPNPGNSNIKSW